MFLQKLIYHSRLINLLIVGITQCIVIFFLFETSFTHSDSSNILYTYLLLIACTLMITLGGYLINDYFDYEIDSINKKSKVRFQKAELLQAYFISTAIGFGIAIAVASIINQYAYLLIYILAIGLLFLYASHFKQRGLIGNFIVSIFSSLVIALLWFVQEYYNLEVSRLKQMLLIFFMIFIFLASMAREIVKDCEDIKGDQTFGLKTFPIQIGIQRTNIFISLFLVTLLIVCSSWLYWIFPLASTLAKISMIPIILLNLYVIFKNSGAKSKEDYAQISLLLKLLMGFGIIALGLISYQL